VTIRALYIYTDDFGRPVFRKVRREPKHFRMQAAVYKNSRLYWKRGRGVVDRYQPEWSDRALYNLPVVLDALRYGEPVHLVEGERDADSLASLRKLAATTNWQGAKAFTPEQASWFVRGRSRIHIVIDNDDAGFYGGWLRYTRLIAAGVSKKQLSVWGPRGGAADLTERLCRVGTSRNALRPVGLDALEERASRESARRASRDYWGSA
jgi:hypothetical protein